MPSSRPRAVVVGGGIAGLTAAYRLGELYDVTVLEAADRVGGKLRLHEVAGVAVDVGAEAMLARRPEGVDLARQLGLEVVHPALASSRIWTRGTMRPLPRSLMGVPIDLDDLAASDVLSPAGLARARQEPGLPPTLVEGDPSLGDLVAERFGDEVVDRLVEPLLGGVYAGHARAISARAALPQLVALAERGSVVEQLAGGPATYSGDGSSPVFAGLPGGLGRLPRALVDSGRFTVRTGVTVRSLTRAEHGFRLTTGPTTAVAVLDAERVVLATPPAATARLLGDVAPVAAAALAAVETASVAVVTLAYRVADVPLAMHAATGFLVPPVEGRAIKAATYSFTKWTWARDAGTAQGVLVLRTSLGRHGEEVALQRTDGELVALSRADLAEAAGLSSAPTDTHVQRWGGGLPQYAVGHLDRVARVRAAVAAVPGLDVCGAAYDGVGIPAVIASAHRATMDP